MEKELILIRHSYDDHSYIDGKNDTSLTKNGIEIAKKEAINLYKQIYLNEVLIKHSTKLRAKETSYIICDYLLSKNIKCNCIQDFGLTELFQGEFNFNGLSHENRINFLQSCWDDFERCRKERCYTHNFGENKDKNIVLKTGENHIEWSLRISYGLINILDDFKKNIQLIGVTHRGAILEIENIIKMINGIIEMQDIEQYETVWMNYCQEKKLIIKDIEKGKTLIKEYIKVRGK